MRTKEDRLVVMGRAARSGRIAVGCQDYLTLCESRKVECPPISLRLEGLKA
ncbi:hypothetical protein [Stutzerimonas azotifigens]|uniref:hypothetical protein n=1 Tax=Stutzerimonas azotifigens TaxID=291995 RepID=UPI001376DF40|nr:hypothetical protein [Stutzerimonas azotifigens]